MNFLAHFHLAWPDQGLIVGALEGDYYKGPLKKDLPGDIARGVALHRAIDAFTDNHEAIRLLRGKLPKGLRRYAGILIDLSFDHFLSLHWQRYSDLPLGEFNAWVHRDLLAREASLSRGAQSMRARLVEHDILNRYHDWQMVPGSARRIGERFSRDNPFVGIEPRLTPLRPDLEAVFLDFYPQLQTFASQRVRALSVHSG